MSTQIIRIRPLPMGLKLMIAWFVLNPALFPLLYWTLPNPGILESTDVIGAILLTVVCWVIAFLLLQRKSWFRRIMVMFLCVGLIVNIPTLGIVLFFQRGYNLLFSIVLVAFNIVFIWYLSKRNTKILFLEGTDIDINDEAALNFRLELDKWNWGAFFLTWIWGLGNRVYIALLVFIPGINIIMLGVLGMNGNLWAWRARRWESIEKFKRSQRKWAIAGLILWLMPLILIIVSFVMWRADFNSIRRNIGQFSEESADRGMPFETDSQQSVIFVDNKISDFDALSARNVGPYVYIDKNGVWVSDETGENKVFVEGADGSTFKEVDDVLFVDANAVWVYDTALHSLTVLSNATDGKLTAIGSNVYLGANKVWFFDRLNGTWSPFKSVTVASFDLISQGEPLVFSNGKLVQVFYLGSLYDITGMDLKSFILAFDGVNTIYKDKLFVYGLLYNTPEHPIKDMVRFISIVGADPLSIELAEDVPQGKVGFMPKLRDKNATYVFNKQTLEYQKVN